MAEGQRLCSSAPAVGRTLRRRLEGAAAAAPASLGGSMQEPVPGSAPAQLLLSTAAPVPFCSLASLGERFMDNALGAEVYWTRE